jgi:hypothetical protein
LRFSLGQSSPDSKGSGAKRAGHCGCARNLVDLHHSVSFVFVAVGPDVKQLLTGPPDRALITDAVNYPRCREGKPRQDERPTCRCGLGQAVEVVGGRYQRASELAPLRQVDVEPLDSLGAVYRDNCDHRLDRAVRVLDAV